MLILSWLNSWGHCSADSLKLPLPQPSSSETHTSSPGDESFSTDKPVSDVSVQEKTANGNRPSESIYKKIIEYYQTYNPKETSCSVHIGCGTVWHRKELRN